MRGGKLPVVVLVPSRMMTSTVIGRELPAVLKSFGEPVSPGITQRVAITEAVIEHQTIGAYAPGSDTTDNRQPFRRRRRWNRDAPNRSLGARRACLRAHRSGSFHYRNHARRNEVCRLRGCIPWEWRMGCHPGWAAEAVWFWTCETS